MRDLFIIFAFIVGGFVGYVASHPHGETIERVTQINVPIGNSIDRVVYDIEFVARVDPTEERPTVETPSPKDTVQLIVKDRNGSPISYVYRIRVRGRELR